MMSKSIVALNLLALLSACSSSNAVPCSDGTKVEHESRSYCVYRTEAITEEGFLCPAALPFRFDFSDFAACGSSSAEPPQTLEEFVLTLFGTGSSAGADAGSDRADSAIGSSDSAAGSGDAGTEDAAADPSACPEINPFDPDGTERFPGGGWCADLFPEPEFPEANIDDLIISQVNVVQDWIEFFNPTDEPIELDGFVLVQPPQFQMLAGTGITVQPRTYATLTDPGAIDFDPAGAGEIALYTSTAFDDRTAIIDFLCWNGDRPMSNRSLAETLDEERYLWFGECAPAPEFETLARYRFASGAYGVDYDHTLTWTCHYCD